MQELKSKTIQLRLVEVDDASFIYTLRCDSRYNKFLSYVNGGVSEQEEWIKRYKESEGRGEQFYFIIETPDLKPCGTVRVYDFNDKSFCWGSWILNENKTKTAALEAALLVYQFGFDCLGFVESHFDVRKDNEKVIRFHEKFGAKKIAEDSENYYFSISKEQLSIVRKKYNRIIGVK
ncbi:hypothetical protein VST7929_02660 [Vibrio stylophorae]|uniref:N-acetyltransferase domain-containing protein n=1 Tax=Vibrio stylophorae TaxID=659351 RepID=A0ABM8ZWJ9_9VIBR|nr:GNAT family N-acetyltransferase [Vibrio stylophorae]CAH0534710.1 hypothetical protein VST7929_02660 [Vibrio stylophorae]